MSDQRKRYTVSAGFLEVYNVEVVASSPDEALAAAQNDWNSGKKLGWYECATFEEPHFQIEDWENEGTRRMSPLTTERPADDFSASGNE